MALWNQTLRRVPLVGRLARMAAQAMGRYTFRNSADYWEARYAWGGDSGAGSKGRLAHYKADVLNAFVAEKQIHNVLELGCGDGQQLALAHYPHYLGVDVSTTALSLCQRRFARDATKSFISATAFTPPPTGRHAADLSLSLDVIYHLVEDAAFERYMQQLFAAAERFVAIYSSNQDAATSVAHVRHRNFTAWIERNCPKWRLLRQLPNPHPCVADDPTTSHADMYFFERTNRTTASHS